MSGFSRVLLRVVEPKTTSKTVIASALVYTHGTLKIFLIVAARDVLLHRVCDGCGERNKHPISRGLFVPAKSTPHFLLSVPCPTEALEQTMASQTGSRNQMKTWAVLPSYAPPQHVITCVPAPLSSSLSPVPSSPPSWPFAFLSDPS